MKDTVTWRYEMFLRVREYGATRATEFSATTLAGELFAGLNEVIARIEAATAKQASERSAALESSDSKAAARDELRRDLEAISRTARAIAISQPGLEDKFRAPRSISDQALLALARAFAADALPLKAEFIRRGLPDDFLEDLASDIEEFEQAINRQIQTQEAQVAATASIDPLIERGVNIVRELDAIMRNKYANDAGALAAWLSASHTQRPARRRPPAPPANTSPAPAQ
ncbi:MAG TPA: hypothetical protein VF544_17325 [Pyrinomonadaceae bacterium]|jgi:hypothetical protein